MTMLDFVRSRPGGMALAVVSLALLTTSSLHAQSQLEVRAHLGAGAFVALGDLPNAPILSSPTNVVSFGNFGAVPTVSLGLEVGAWGLPASLRVKATRTFTGRETGVWGCADAAGGPLPCPSILIEVPSDITATAATADVVGKFEFGPGVIGPMLGVGWIRYSYGWDPTPVGSFSLEPGAAGFNATVMHYGVAIGIPLDRFRFEAELGEYVSSSHRGRPNRSRSGTFGLSMDLR